MDCQEIQRKSLYQDLLRQAAVARYDDGATAAALKSENTCERFEFTRGQVVLMGKGDAVKDELRFKDVFKCFYVFYSFIRLKYDYPTRVQKETHF